MNRRHSVAGVMQDVARLDFDRLEIGCEKLEISWGKLPEQIVLGPTGHSFFSCLAGNRRRPEPYVSVAEPTVPKCTQDLAES
jgi:hypothetical protein